MQDGDYKIKRIGLCDVPTNKIVIASPLKEIPKEAKKEVIKDVEILRDIQEFQAKGFSEKKYLSLVKGIVIFINNTLKIMLIILKALNLKGKF